MSGFGIRPRRKKKGIRVGVIPDTQDKPGAPKDHWAWIGRWIRDRRPDVLVHLGDGPSLDSCSTHEEPGTLDAEGKDLLADLESFAVCLGMLDEEKGPADPEKHVVLGNHENRLAAWLNANPELRQMFREDPFLYEAFGWKVHPFLQPVVIEGTAYAHFFPRSSNGRVVQTRNGPPSALAMIKREMRSCVAGHQQGIDSACLPAGGRILRGVVAGSCYLHTEDYAGPQGQGYWTGVLEFNEAADGYFDIVEASLEFLCDRYGRGRWPKA